MKSVAVQRVALPRAVQFAVCNLLIALPLTLHRWQVCHCLPRKRAAAAQLAGQLSQIFGQWELSLARLWPSTCPAASRLQGRSEIVWKCHSDRNRKLPAASLLVFVKELTFGSPTSPWRKRKEVLRIRPSWGRWVWVEYLFKNEMKSAKWSKWAALGLMCLGLNGGSW